MKLTESQLRNIVRKTIAEAISQNDYNMANKFMNANYSRDHANPTNLFQMIKQAVVSKQGKDIEGNLDILDSAKQIYPLIQQFNAEIAKLKRVYNYFSKRANGNYTPTKTTRTPMDAARKQKMLATRAMNKQERDRIMAQYGDIDTPDYAYTNKQNTINPSMAQKGLNRMKDNRSNPKNMAGSNWFGMNESVKEGMFGGNSVDMVDDAVANYRKYTPEQMKAIMPKIQERITDYQRVVKDLQGKLDSWTGENGSIYDRNAQARAERDAALRNVGKRSTTRRAAANGLEESIDRCVKEAIKKVLG